MKEPRKPVIDMQERRSSVLPVQGAAVSSFLPRRVAWYE